MADHRTVNSWMKAGGTAVFSLAILRLLLVAAANEGKANVLLFCAVLLVLVVVVSSRVRTQQRRWEQLKREDPQLFEIYNKLDAGKKAGRL